MSDEDWAAGFAKSLGVFLNGKAIPSRGPRGERIVDDSFYVIFNAHHEPLTVHPARARPGAAAARWSSIRAESTRRPDAGRIYRAGEEMRWSRDR